MTDEQRARALKSAQKEVQDWVDTMLRAGRRVKFWQSRVAYYERQVSLTPEERAARAEAARERRNQRRRRTRRIVVSA